MIHDLGETTPGELPAYDLCIVGSGPAGITLAAELAGSGLRVCVLESGRVRPTPDGDALREVESEGIQIKDWSRERVFGGASTTWAGLSSPLDPIDLAEREFLPHSGWPIAPAELMELYAEAERYRFPSLRAFTESGFGALRAKGEHQPEWKQVAEKVFLAAAEPQDFGREHRKVFDGAECDLYLGATVVRIASERGADGQVRATHAVVRVGMSASSRSASRSHSSANASTPSTPHAGSRSSASVDDSLDGNSNAERRLVARAFVLATGGIENARLLLLSRDVEPAGLGNAHDQVGRCLMNHPKNNHGILHLERPATKLPYYFGCLWNGFAGYAGLRFTEQQQKSRRVLNSYVRFEPLFPWSDSEGVESLVTLAKKSRVVLDRFRKRDAGEVVELRDYSETGDDSELQNARRGPGASIGLVWNIVRDAPRVSRYAWNRVVARARPKITRVRLRNFMEMEPHADNRVTLSTKLDAHGVPLPHVRHAPTELDRRSLIELHAVLREEFARAGLGRLETQLAETNPWPIDQDASHHMGTTRMGRDPRTSVVDPGLRVHGSANVFAAGASVFPTSGCANPTFTIVALSIRLARRLREELGAGKSTADFAEAPERSKSEPLSRSDLRSTPDRSQAEDLEPPRR